MEDWRRGSTPINVFIVDRDLRNSKVFVTYSQDGSVIVEKTNDELTITEDQIIVNLSQTDTLNFHEGLIDIQIRFIDDDGYISKPLEFINLVSGKRFRDINKVPFSKENLTEDENIVMYEYNDGTHFVIMDKNADVIWDPSGFSNSVKYGVPVSIRKFVN